jgi:hypothetical protein
MTLLAAVTVSMSAWVWMAAGATGAALVVLIVMYRRTPNRDIWHTIALSLKLLGVVLLALCLIEPLSSSQRAKTGANLFLVVADNSAGMAIRDQGETRTRGELLRDTLQAGQGGWLADLVANFQVRSYLFDSRLHRTTDFSDLTFDGRASSIASTLRTIAERYRGRPLAGVMLLTDGIATDAGDLPVDLSEMPPVYPVVIGQTQVDRDIVLANVAVSQTAFEDAPVTIQADVEASGFAGRTVAVDLTDSAGNRVERQQWAVRRSEDKQTLRFRLRPARTGVLFYTLRAAELSNETSPQDESSRSEATMANNSRTIVVDRGQGPHRILYVCGRPNWEYKFLQRAVADDSQIQLVALLRVARREPKYDWRGHSGESSNPLYRGFDEADQETAEPYDQPVLVRLNTRDQDELRDGFPKTAEQLYDYEAVILDDVEAGFFTHDQMELLRRFVLERGGGFLMLGGKDSFHPGGFDRTPIAALLPVYDNPANSLGLDRFDVDSTRTEIRMSLTREGWLQPWVRLRDNEQDERLRLSGMPDFRVLNRVGAPKAGARVLATVGSQASSSGGSNAARRSEQALPLLVVQRLGNGRTASITLGDVWRWGMQRPDLHEDMDKFWRQTLRWLVAQTPDRISVQVAERSEQAGQAVVLHVRARDKSFEPTDNVRVTVDVDTPGENPLQLTAEPVLNDSGLFETVYVPRVSGGYLARVTVRQDSSADPGDGEPNSTAGTVQGYAQAGWASDLEAREFASVKTNRPLLEKIARTTGGHVVEPDELESFARDLPSREVPISTVWVRPLWDLRGVLPTLYLLVAACFIGEWAIRRWKGLP